MVSDYVPDTGDLRSDVLALLRHVSQRVQAIGMSTLHGLMAEYLDDVPVSAYLYIRQVSMETMMTILKRAAARGEVRVDHITPRMASLLMDLVRHELFFTNLELPEEAIVEIVDDIFLLLVRLRG
ncbi:TetR-like C-terminal domain-containing protein [Alicyclobacillus kakegawensis]|uniref:TetR-like C-terminal domain-containing protein n=1 Tax=Alicyclobacillus kakegawensis TaxID=392012 RepID=UPI0009F85E68|nr:TetR-like C-terminal domain-containing protein [Alicyclobacillus kakegawensis]